MSEFWRQHKGGLIISIFSVLLGAAIQIGMNYIRHKDDPKPVVQQPMAPQAAPQPVVRSNPPVIYTTPMPPPIRPPMHSKHR